MRDISPDGRAKTILIQSRVPAKSL